MKFYNYDGVKNISGERVYQARTSRHMTQADLAAKMQVLGVTIEREAISKIETGDRLVTDYELAAFARIFHVTLDWLIENEYALRTLCPRRLLCTKYGGLTAPQNACNNKLQERGVTA